jgi:hypothetical protein
MLQRLLPILFSGALAASAQVKVPIAAPEQSKAQAFRDSHYGVRFTVPPGWELNKKDRQISTFRLDAKSAKSSSEMRAVASMNFNPFPLSTLSGALFYYSVERHTTDRECELQAVDAHKVKSNVASEFANKNEEQAANDIQNIGGMSFTHGHEEGGRGCMESRDDVYTAFRKGSCYRFDLIVNMFCSDVSGAQDLTFEQMNNIESRMAGILSSIAFDWEKAGPHAVPAPLIAPAKPDKPTADPGVTNPQTKATLGVF